MTTTDRDSEGSLLELARSLLGDSAAGLVDREIHFGDVVVQIDQLRFSNVTTEVLPHFERMAKHAADVATAGPFDPLRALKAGLSAMTDSLDSVREAAQLAQEQFRDAATGRISIGTDLFGQSSRVVTPHIELDHLVVTCPALWLHVAPLGQTRPAVGSVDIEFDDISLTGRMGYGRLIRELAVQLPSYLRPIQTHAPNRTNSPIAIAARWLPAGIRAPLSVTVDGATVIVEIDSLVVGRRLARLSPRLRQRHEFMPLGPSASLTSVTFDESGLIAKATLPPIRWQLDSRRVKALLASSKSSPRSTLTW